MNPVKFPGFNGNYGKPKNWDESKDGECLTLPVKRIVDPESGCVAMVSVWKPTEKEKISIMAGQNIVLTCYGAQVPVFLTVRDIPGEIVLFQDEKSSPEATG